MVSHRSARTPSQPIAKTGRRPRRHRRRRRWMSVALSSAQPRRGERSLLGDRPAARLSCSGVLAERQLPEVRTTAPVRSGRSVTDPGTAGSGRHPPMAMPSRGPRCGRSRSVSGSSSSAIRSQQVAAICGGVANCLDASPVRIDADYNLDQALAHDPPNLRRASLSTGWGSVSLQVFELKSGPMSSNCGNSVILAKLSTASSPPLSGPPREWPHW